jgi:hypothetical protein
MANEVEPYGTATALTANAFSYTGHSFAGWNTAANGTGTAYAGGASYPFTASATLYAQWTLNSVTVVFNASSGSGTMANEVEPYGTATALTANAFSYTGHSFAGWNTAANGTGTAYAGGASYPFTASATLYAQWSAGAAQVITFTSTNPSPVTVGSSPYDLTATGGASGNPVIFTIDASSSDGACLLEENGTTVDFTGTGTCVIDANQAAGFGYTAASQAQQVLTVNATPITQTITMAATGSTTFDQSGLYNVDASSNDSGATLVYTIDSSGNTAHCSVDSSGLVSFTGLGHCTIDVNSAADGAYAAASQAQLVLTIGAQSQTITMAATGSTTFDQSGLYNVDASSNDSGATLVYTIDSSGNTAHCSVDSSGLVSFTGLGHCTIDVNSAADGAYAAASQAQLVLTIGVA